MICSKDIEAFKEYERFFTYVMIFPKQLRSMYIENNMETRVESDRLTIWHDENVWQILSLDEDEPMQLRHNNYRKNKDESRKFVSEFHIQNDKCRSYKLKYALSVISGYNYENYHIQDKIMEKDAVRKMQVSGEADLEVDMAVDVYCMEVIGERGSKWKEIFVKMRRGFLTF